MPHGISEGSSQPGAATRMLDETLEQPQTIQRTFAALLPLRPQLAQLLMNEEGEPRHVLFAARGTSDHAAIYGRYLLESTAGFTTSLAAPSIATHYNPATSGELSPRLNEVVVVSLSQSGSTEEIVATQRWAKARGATTVAITNAPASTLATEADLALDCQAGDEIAVPATKSYTAQLCAVAVLGMAACDAAGSTVGDELAQESDVIPGLVEEILANSQGVAQAVEILQEAESTVAVGRGILLGSALEAGIKLEETCLRPVRGYSYADMLHGPVAAVSQRTAAIVIAADDGPLREAMHPVAKVLKERGATIIGIGGDQDFAAECAIHFSVSGAGSGGAGLSGAGSNGSGLSEALLPITSILPVQLIAESLSRALGLNPDSPEGLNKVTVTDSEE